MMVPCVLCIGFTTLAAMPLADDSLFNRSFPQVELSNGLVKARVYLPDPGKGYYRGARFDWSGVVSSLEYNGHQYFGEWFDEHDPLKHDGIVGPVEEFGPLGFEEAAPGEEFVKIGIGCLVKPDDQPYVFHKPYRQSSFGTWQVESRDRELSFTHILEDAGYP